MDNDNWDLMADRNEKKDRKRIQNRVAQRLYRTRMRQRVEELEKEVNNYRLQAQAQNQREEITAGDGHGKSDGEIIMVNGSVTNEAKSKPGAQDQDHENRRKASITVDTGPPGRTGRARSSSSNIGRQNANNHRMAEENGAGPTPVITPGPSPPSHSRILTTSCNPQPQSPMHQQQESSESGGSVSQSQPQSYGPTISQQQGSPRQSDEPREALRSPTDLAAAAYINPGILSHATHPRPSNAFVQPYYSPPISSLGTYQLPSYMDFSMTPLTHQGQFSPHSQEWPWPTAGSSDSNRRVIGGQEETRDDFGPEPEPPLEAPTQQLREPGDTETYVAIRGHASGAAHNRASSSTSHGAFASGGVDDPRELSPEAQDVEADVEIVSPSAARSPAATFTTDGSSPFQTDAGELRTWGMVPADAERLQEFSSTLQEALAGLGGRTGTNTSADGRTQKRPGNLDSGDKARIRDRSLEDRFEFVRLCLAAAGFSSIDSMVGEYYTADFSHDSPIARQQRVSRHSQLPVLVAQLRKNAKTWSQWEAHGYQSEIMDSAVSLIKDEQKGFVASKRLFAGARSELERLQTEERPSAKPHSAGRSSSSGTFQLLTKTLQDSVRSSLLEPLCTTSHGD